jgi:hypothetical protein
MRASSNYKAFLIIVTVVAAVFMLSTSAVGQCSMCRTALTSANNALFVRNFNIGVLVLLVPPVTIFCSIFVVLKRYRTADDENSGLADQDAPESKPDSRH